MIMSNMQSAGLACCARPVHIYTCPGVPSMGCKSDGGRYYRQRHIDQQVIMQLNPQCPALLISCR